MEERIKQLESNLSKVSQELISLKDLIAAGFTKVDTNFSVIEKKLNLIDKKIYDLTSKVERLDNSTTDGLNDVGTKIESLTEEIQKINTVTQYDEQFRNIEKLN